MKNFTQPTDPKLNDWWTQNKRTDLAYSGDILTGGGISLSILFPAFLEKKLVWYSATDGYYLETPEDYENLYIIGVNREISSQLKNISHQKEGPIKKHLGKIFLSEEYILSREVSKQLNLKKLEDVYKTKNQDIKLVIVQHDDCFPWIKPVDKKTLSMIIERIIGLHAFYLKTKIEMQKAEEVKQGIILLFNRGENIRIESKIDENNQKVIELSLGEITRYLLFFKDTRFKVAKKFIIS